MDACNIIAAPRACHVALSIHSSPTPSPPGVCAGLMTLYTIAEVLIISLLVMPMPSNALRGKIQGQAPAVTPPAPQHTPSGSLALVLWLMRAQVL